MSLPYPKRREVIDMTKSKLAKMQLYTVPPQPCNDNQNKLNQNKEDTACLRLANQVGASWKARQASLLAVVGGNLRSQEACIGFSRGSKEEGRNGRGADGKT